MLFAINRVPHPGEKRLVQLAIRECPPRPTEMQQPVEALLQASASADQQILARVDNLLDGLDLLLEQSGLRPAPPQI